MSFFETKAFMPHGHCYLWKPEILFTHVISDGLITISYLVIPFALIYLVKKRDDIPFNWIFMMFAAFILGCGITHAISIWTTWVPAYGIEAIGKAFTALVSVATAIVIWPLIPKALAIPSQRDLRKVYSELKLKSQELEEKSQDLELVSRMTAHDLLAPIKRIITFTEIEIDQLKDSQDNPARVPENLTIILENALQITKIVESSKKITRIDQAALVLTKLNLNQYVDKLRSIYINSEQRKIFADPLPEVMADEILIEQVFFNLFENAVKYGPKDLQIRIFSEEENESHYRIHVTNNLAGPCPQLDSNIFAPYNRQHKQKTIEGLGLGLTICKKIVERHEGEISVNASDETVDFSFTLRRA